jgi:hypothetical protein
MIFDDQAEVTSHMESVHTCMYCGMPLTYDAWLTYGYGTRHSSVARRRYCSNACRQAAYRKRTAMRRNLAPFAPSDSEMDRIISAELKLNEAMHQRLVEMEAGERRKTLPWWKRALGWVRGLV